MKVTDRTANALMTLTAMRIRFLEQLHYAVIMYDARRYTNAMAYQFHALWMYDEYLDKRRKYGNEHTAALEYHLLGWE